MKLSMSLSSVPDASSVAPSELSTNAPAVAAIVTNQRPLSLDQAQRERERREREGGDDAGPRPLERHRAGRAGAHARHRRETGRCAVPQALPISLATVSLAPATSAAVMASSAPSR